MARPGIAIFTQGRFTTGTTTPVSKGLSIYTQGRFGKLPLSDVLDGDIVEFDFTIQQQDEDTFNIQGSAQENFPLSLARQDKFSVARVFAQTFTIARVESAEFTKDIKASEFER